VIRHPGHIEEYRQATAKLKMIGVSFHVFRCRRCGGSKPIKGRKKLAGREGFICADCAGGKK